MKSEINKNKLQINKCPSCKGGCAPTAVYARVKNDVNASVGQYVKLHSENKQMDIVISHIIK